MLPLMLHAPSRQKSQPSQNSNHVRLLCKQASRLMPPSNSSRNFAQPNKFDAQSRNFDEVFWSFRKASVARKTYPAPDKTHTKLTTRIALVGRGLAASKKFKKKLQTPKNSSQHPFPKNHKKQKTEIQTLTHKNKNTPQNRTSSNFVGKMPKLKFEKCHVLYQNLVHFANSQSFMNSSPCPKP